MTASATRDFFVSYAAADADWAAWIAWRLEAAGYAVALQAWDFRPGGNFVADMEAALKRSHRVVAVLSVDYLASDFANAEWFAAFARDPRGERGLLLPVRVADCAVEGLLAQIVWVDLVGLDEAAAAARLLDAAAPGRAKPTVAPRFPIERQPAFPPLAPDAPYRGLAAFEAEHRADFRGRDRYVAAAEDRLARSGRVCVIGASGGGKSSLIKGGLLPRLSDAGRRTVALRPRADPFAALARGLVPLLEPGLGDVGPRALAADAYAARLRADPDALGALLAALEDAGPGPVLAIDQFEELFTQTPDAQQAAFVQAMARAWSRGGGGDALWVFGLRADFLDQALAFDHLRGLLQDDALLLGPMTAEELLAGIVEPARSRGVRFEPGLPERIVADARADDQAGAGAAARLPLVQFALAELWRRRRHGVVTHAAYDDAGAGIGGIEGALRRHAERAFAGLDPDRQRRAPHIFRRLARRGSARVDVGRSATRAELEDDWPLVVELGRQRLISITDVAGAPSVEIVHEALFRAWPALRGWIEENREFDQWRQDLGQQVARWRAAPDAAKADMLLRGGVLDLAMARAAERADELSTGERAFVAASDAARRGQARRRTGFLAAAFAALAGVAALAGLQWQRAETERAVAVAAQAEAQSQADLAVARRLARVAADVLEGKAGETSVAAMIAVASTNRRATPEAVQVLRDALRLTPAEVAPAPVPWRYAQTVISADGRTQAFYRADALYAFRDDVEPHATVHLLSRDTLETVVERRRPASSRPRFSPDGRWLAAGGAGRRLVVRDAATGDVALDEGYRVAVYPVFSPDGATLYAVRSDGVIEVRRRGAGWSVARTLAFPVDGEQGPPLAVDVTPDGDALVVLDTWRAAYSAPTGGGETTTLAAYDGLRGLEANNATVVAVSPTEALALVQRNRGEAALWDLATGAPRFDFADGGYARAAVFSPDGSRVATANHRGAVMVRRVADGAVLRAWEHGAEVAALAFSPDGAILATTGEDATTALWSLGADAAARRIRHDGAGLALAFDAADGALLIGDAAGALTRVDPAAGAVRGVRRFQGRVAAVAVSGARVAVTVQESRAEAHWEDVVFIDRDTGAARGRIMRNADHQAQRLSPDGARYATWDRQREALTLWDTLTGAPTLTIPDVSLGTYAFSPDGARVMVNLPNGPVRAYDTETGAVLFELGEPGGVDAAVLQPETGVLVTRGGDSVRGWDLATGAPLWRTETETDHPVLSGDGTRVADRDAATGAVVVRDTATGAPVARLPDDGFVRGLSWDGGRLMTARRVIGDDDAVTHDVALWDVARGVALHRSQVGRLLDVDALGPELLALRDHRFDDGDWRVVLSVLDLSTGRRLWSATYEDQPFNGLFPLAGAPNRLLIKARDALELRDAATGALLWRQDYADAVAAAAPPGGAWLAVVRWVGPQQAAIVILDPETGAERRRIPVDEAVVDLRVTADGARIVAAVRGDRFDGLRVWRARDGAALLRIALDAGPDALVPLGDPERIALRDFSGRLRVFDLTTGAVVRAVAHAPRAASVAHAAAADRAVTWSGASLRLWDARTGRELAARTTDGAVVRASLSPDGRRVAYRAERPRTADSGTEFETVTIWTPGDAADTVALPVEGVGDIAFDRGGARLLLTERNGAWLRIVDAETLRTLATLRPLPGGKITAAAVNGDETALVTREMRSEPFAGQGRNFFSVRAFALSDFREIARSDAGGGRFHLAQGEAGYWLTGRDGRWRRIDPWSGFADRPLADDAPGDDMLLVGGTRRLLASGYWAGAAVYDGDAPGAVVELAPSAEQGAELGVLDAAISRDGRVAATSLRATEWTEATPGVVVVRSAETGAELARLPVERPMWQVAFADGGEAALLFENQFSGLPRDADSLSLLWRWRTGAVTTLQTDNPVGGIAVSPDGGRFATVEGYVNDDGEEIGVRRLRLWRADGAVLAEFALDINAYRVAFAQDGRHIAVSGPGGVRLFSAPDLRLAHGWRNAGARGAQQDHVVQNAPTVIGSPALGFAEGGGVLAAQAPSGALLYDIASGAVAQLRESAEVKGMAVSPDGALIAFWGDAFVSVWDAATRSPLSRFAAPRFRRLRFGGPAGRDLIGLRDGAVFDVAWAPDALAARVCAALSGGDWRRRVEQLIGEEIARPCDGR